MKNIICKKENTNFYYWLYDNEENKSYFLTFKENYKNYMILEKYFRFEIAQKVGYVVAFNNEIIKEFRTLKECKEFIKGVK